SQQVERGTLYRPQQDSEGEGRHELEMKLGVEEGASETSVLSDMVALISNRPKSRKKVLVYLSLASLLLLLIAFLLGYVTFRNTCRSCPSDTEECMAASAVNEVDYGWQNTDYSSETTLHWDDLRTMLNKYLDKEQLTDNIRAMSQRPHPAGSRELQRLDKLVLSKLHSYQLNHVWTDSHYVTLPYPDSSSPNYLWMVDSNGAILEKIHLTDQDAFLAYSATGNVTGGLVYGHYGRHTDFLKLRDLGVTVKGNIVLIRSEKVAMAQTHGAVGVLLYPDPADVPQEPRGTGPPRTTALSGHVHLGTGDPFTPGFPSFNHTQFPPVEASALPRILALTISPNTALSLIGWMGGGSVPSGWRGMLSYPAKYVLGPNLTQPGVQLQMGVSCRMVSTVISNIFGSIEGFIEPDRYIIVGAQRDSWGPGAAKSGVGTAILLELAHALSEMVTNGECPSPCSQDSSTQNIVDINTDQISGYLTMMHLKAVAYFSLDRAVLGDDTLVAQSSPLLHQLIEKVMKQVRFPLILLNSSQYTET
ncbi:transferrin receptor protein 2-like, partial [Leucoraja erinacea]|uniref:transferrin receptor protein 2-like n=1 Tax=Leucoraja erinaceus TaxID=7782 RepID=UPI002457CD90